MGYHRFQIRRHEIIEGHAIFWAKMGGYPRILVYKRPYPRHVEFLETEQGFSDSPIKQYWANQNGWGAAVAYAKAQSTEHVLES